MNAAREPRKPRDRETGRRFFPSPCLLVFLACGLPISVSSLGCHSCEHVEAELRAREAELHQVREQLHRTAAVNQALQSQLHQVQQTHSAKVAPGSPAPFSVISSIVLARQTGGYDTDRIPGDEGLQVVLEPRSPDGQTIRAAGSVHLQLSEVGRDGRKTALSSWDIAPEQLNESWRPGLWSTGYFLVLPWKAWPEGNKLHLLVRFTDAAGHSVSAEKSFPIRPTAPGQRKPAPPPELDTPLPAPRSVTSAYPPAGAPPSSKLPPVSPAQRPLHQAIELLKPEPLDNPMLEPPPKR